MRTILGIDEDILRAVKDLAALHKLSLGGVISDLARRGLLASVKHRKRLLPVLEKKPGARPVTMSDVRSLVDLESIYP